MSADFEYQVLGPDPESKRKKTLFDLAAELLAQMESEEYNSFFDSNLPPITLPDKNKRTFFVSTPVPGEKINWSKFNVKS